MAKQKLDNYEKELLETVENNQWQSVSDIEQEKLNLKKYANYTLEKMQKINLEIYEQDLLQIKRKSVEFGVPYNVLLQSLIHNFATGKLKLTV